jgi:hypothetical protein
LRLFYKKKVVSEDVPTNAMGASSSSPATGAIDTYDPLLDLGGGKVKNKMRKKLLDILRRKLAGKNV